MSPGILVQQVGCTTKFSTDIAEGLVSDYFILLPHAVSKLSELPLHAPLFTANLLTSLSEMYNKSNINPNLLAIITEWISKHPDLCYTALVTNLQSSLPSGAIPMPAMTPFVGLFKWCILAPFYVSNSNSTTNEASKGTNNVHANSLHNTTPTENSAYKPSNIPTSVNIQNSSNTNTSGSYSSPQSNSYTSRTQSGRSNSTSSYTSCTQNGTTPVNTSPSALYSKLHLSLLTSLLECKTYCTLSTQRNIISAESLCTIVSYLLILIEESKVKPNGSEGAVRQFAGESMISSFLYAVVVLTSMSTA